MAQCYEIDLYKNSVKIYRSGEEIMISIEIPESLRSAERQFAVLRVHNGECEILNDIDSSSQTVTIKTDRFSQYALICKAILDDSSDTSDTSGSSDSSVTSDVSDDSDTSDSSNSSDSSTSDSSTNSDSSESSITESSDNSSETHDTSSTADDDINNPNTGYMFSLLPVLLLAGGAMMFAKKSRK